MSFEWEESASKITDFDTISAQYPFILQRTNGDILIFYTKEDSEDNSYLGYKESEYLGLADPSQEWTQWGESDEDITDGDEDGRCSTIEDADQEIRVIWRAKNIENDDSWDIAFDRITPNLFIPQYYVKIKEGLEISTDNIEWHDVFWGQIKDVASKNVGGQPSLQLTAYDKMHYFENSVEGGYDGQSVEDIIENLALQVGFLEDEIDLEATGVTVNHIEFDLFDTHDGYAALDKLSEHIDADYILYVDGEGTLKGELISQADSSDGDLIRAKIYENPYSSKEIYIRTMVKSHKADYLARSSSQDYMRFTGADQQLVNGSTAVGQKFKAIYSEDVEGIDIEARLQANDAYPDGILAVEVWSNNLATLIARGTAVGTSAFSSLVVTNYTDFNIPVEMESGQEIVADNYYAIKIYFPDSPPNGNGLYFRIEADGGNGYGEGSAGISNDNGGTYTWKDMEDLYFKVNRVIGSYSDEELFSDVTTTDQTLLNSYSIKRIYKEEGGENLITQEQVEERARQILKEVSIAPMEITADVISAFPYEVGQTLQVTDELTGIDGLYMILGVTRGYAEGHPSGRLTLVDWSERGVYIPPIE